ncbi:hypothetical protein A8L34_27935 [Bacillus sp. FJAT-27264]|uniref:hypothetical protein n=1 Tax=Paenibacillus sp. (strain DSM 101736 / FJAT-27264) TaxID=1850362 RepID=UPI000807DE69|nr:hypothetical protein [Bacillus sp. FJAT-27264]OBZ15879.1 hypothetical protein A8L34_27935 [Bacillus sp. FJAT-27264]
MQNPDLFLRIMIIGIPCVIVMWLLRSIRSIVRPDHQSVWNSVKHFYTGRVEAVQGFYSKESAVDKMFKDAGIYLEPSKIRIARDTTIVVFLAYLIVNYFTKGKAETFPYETIILTFTVYFMTLLVSKPPFPSFYILGYLKKMQDKKKNKEIAFLQQMVLSEYAGGENQTQQRVYYLFMYLIKRTKAIHSAMLEFVSNYNVDGKDLKKPFDDFAESVGTEEAKDLAEVLYSIDSSSADNVKELLKAQYDELKTVRQENYRSTMQDRGNFGYFMTFAGVAMVIGLGLIIYYLENQDQVRFLVVN